MISLLLLFLGQTWSQVNLDNLANRHAFQSLDEFRELLSIPCDAHFPEDIEKNVQWYETAFAKRNFTTKRLETATVPLLLAERKTSRPNA